MKGIDKITERITSDAENEVQLLLDTANSEAESILSEYKKQAELEASEIAAQSLNDATERKHRRAGAAALESGKARLALKQELIDKAFELALNKLADLPESELVPLLVKLAVSASRTGSEQIIMNMSDREHFGKKIVKQVNEQLEQNGKTGAVTLSDQIRHLRGGLILADGNVEINCEFGSIARIIRDDLAADIADILFGDD